MPIIWNICKAESWTDNEGNEKTKWHNLGTLFEKDGKYSVKAWGVWFNVFPPKPKEEVASVQEQERARKIEKANTEIDPKDLPF